MAAGWPTSVPQRARNGLNAQPEVNLVEFKTEVGPPKRRRRTSVATEILNFRTRMTFDQYEDLKDFHARDLKDGTLSFMRKDPRDYDGPDVEFEFVGEPPKFDHTAVDFGDVTLALRRLP